MELVLGVMTVIITAVGVAVAWMQWWRPRQVDPEHEVGGAASQGPGNEAGIDPSAVQVLRPPTGRLPPEVRGRVDLLSLLTSQLEAPDGRIHVLAGLGGVGKTTIALSVGAAAMDLKRPVWWVPVVDAATIREALLGLARELGAPSSEIDEARAGRRDASGLLWRYLERTTGWVLVFDNADDISALSTDKGPVSDGTGWVRPSRRGLVLVTTRNSDPSAWGRDAVIHLVPLFSERDGAKVLLDLAPEAGGVADASQLSARLGGLALALYNAGSYLASHFANERTFTGYQTSLEEHFRRLMDRHGEMDDRSAVMTTWELSLDILGRKGVEYGRPLLRILSCFASAAPIPYRLIDGIARSDRLTHERLFDALAALTSVGLIETRKSSIEENRMDVLVHPLVAETQRARFKPEDRKVSFEAAVNALRKVVNTLDSAKSGEWPIWLQLLPHMKVLLDPQWEEGIPQRALVHLLNLTSYTVNTLIWMGRWSAALELAQRAVSAASPLEENHPATLEVRHCFAATLMDNGLLQESEAELRNILDLRDKSLGPNHPDSLKTRARLATLLRLTNRLEEAEGEFSTILERRKIALGEYHLDTLDARHDLIHVRTLMGDLGQAEQGFRQLLNIRRKILGSDHPSTLANLHDLSFALKLRGVLDQAEKGFQSVRDQWVKIESEEHPSALHAEYELAMVHRIQGQKDWALKELKTVLKKRQKILGESHPTTLETQLELALTLLLLDRFEEAEREIRTVLSRGRAVLGNEHPVMATALRALNPYHEPCS